MLNQAKLKSQSRAFGPLHVKTTSEVSEQLSREEGELK